MSKRKSIAAVTTGSGFHIFGLGTENEPFHKYWDGSAWHPSQTDWEGLGGVAGGPPAVTFSDPGSGREVDVIILGMDNQLYHKYWDGSVWHPSQTGWEGLGGRFINPPEMDNGPTGSPTIVGVGTDNQIYAKYWYGGAWHPSQTGWEALGGTFISAPAVAGWGTPPRIDIVGIGTDHQIYHKYSDGSAWYPSQTGWEALGGGFVDNPVIAGVTDIKFDIVGLGFDNHVYHKVYQSQGGWSPSQTGWEGLGGVAGSVPAVVQTVSPFDRFDVYVLGMDNQLFHKYKPYFAGGWQPSQTDWEALGSVFNGAPAVDSILINGVSAIHVVAVGTDNQMYHKYWDGSVWHPSQTGWEGLGGVFTIP